MTGALFEIHVLSKKLKIMFIVKGFPKVYTACHTYENRIKSECNLNNANKRFAEPSRAECLGCI